MMADLVSLLAGVVYGAFYTALLAGFLAFAFWLFDKEFPTDGPNMGG